MAGRERSSAAPEVAGILFVGTVASKNFFQHAGNDQAVQQRLGSENANLASFGVVPPCAINIRTGNNGNQSVGCADVRDAATPADLAAAVFKGVRNMGIGGNQRSNRSRRHQPFKSIFTVNVEWAGEDVLLIENNVEEQFF